MRIKMFHILTLAVALWLTSAAGVQAQSPAPAGSPAATAKKAPPVDKGKTMRKVLSGISLTPDEKAKVEKILNDPTMKGAKRRDAVRAVLSKEHQAQFDSLWVSAHKKK